MCMFMVTVSAHSCFVKLGRMVTFELQATPESMSSPNPYHEKNDWTRPFILKVWLLYVLHVRSSLRVSLALRPDEASVEHAYLPAAIPN